MHIKRSGMRILAAYADNQIADPDNAGNDADRRTIALQHGALLDVDLDVAGKRPARVERAGKADPLKFVDQSDPIVIRARERKIEVIDSSKDAGGDKRRTKPGTLFVRPIDQLNRNVR